MRWLMRASSLATLAAMLLASYFFVSERASEERPAFFIPETEFYFDSLSPGQHEFSIFITNQSADPRRVLGLTQGCGNNCCFRSKHIGGVMLAPGETLEYKAILQLFEQGSFESGMELYLEEAGLRKVVLVVRGTVSEKPDVANFMP